MICRASKFLLRCYKSQVAPMIVVHICRRDDRQPAKRGALALGLARIFRR
jgi:hypothetical protein